MANRSMIGRAVEEIAVCKNVKVETLLTSMMTHAEWQVLKDEAQANFNAAKAYLDYICSIEPDPIDP